MSVLDDWSLLRLSAAGESMLTVSAVPFREFRIYARKGCIDHAFLLDFFDSATCLPG